MKKKEEYKVGDTIRLSREKFAFIEGRVAGTKVTIEFLSQLFGNAQKELWTLVAREYPELSRKYHLSHSDGLLKVGEKREVE